MCEVQIFIETVRKYPYLFDTSHEHYKNVSKKAEAWKKIAKEMNMTSEAAKTKWKNLRDSYLRYKKSMKKYSKWPWSSQMSFLDAIIQYRPHGSNIPQVILEVEDEDEIPSSPNHPVPQTENNYEPNQLPSSPEMSPPPPLKKKKSQSDALENISSNSDIDKLINFLRTKKSHQQQIDGVDHLFQSYAATFRTFRPKTQAMLKLKLATLFAETELDELQELKQLQELDVSPTSPAVRD